MFVVANRWLCVWHENVVMFSETEVGTQEGDGSISGVSSRESEKRSFLATRGVPPDLALGAFYVFAVSAVFNLNASLMSSQKSRSRLNFQVFYISAVAAWTHWEMWRGRDWFVAAGASSFSALRQLEWAFTTPVLLVLVQHLHAFAFAELGVEMDGHGEGTERTAACTADGTPENTTKGGTSVQTSKGNASVNTSKGNTSKGNTSKGNTSKGNASRGNTSTGNASAYHSAKDAKRSRSEWKYDRANTTTLVSVDLVMLACGLLMPFFSGYSVTRFLLLGASISSFAFVIGHSVAALVDVTLHADVDVTDGARLLAMLSLKVVCWSAYPVIYFATESGYLTTQQQHVYYLYNDVLTKFTYSLVISAGSLRCLDKREERRQRIATQISEAQRVFFFNVTHELRTPLNSIIGFNTLAVETGELGLLASGFIKNSLTSAETLLRLIDQILDVGAQARESSGNSVSGNSASVDSVSGNSVSGNSASGNSTSGDATAGDEPFTLSQLVEFVTHATRFPKEKRTVAESVTRNAEGPENENFGADRHPDVVVTLTNPQYFTKTLTGDFQNLRSCLVTLVDNAVKFSTDLPGRDGLVELVIEVTEKETHEEEGRVRRTLSHSDECGDFELEPLRSVSITFRVKDNGIGIPLEKQHALFVPFCQPADRRAPGTGQKEKGTGLGLVLTRQKVARMGGALDFKSVPDRGTKFFFACEFAVRSETESVLVPRMRATTLKLARGGSVDTVFTLPGDSSGSSSGDEGEGSGQKLQPGLRGSASKKGGEAGRIDEKIPPPVAIARPTASIPKDTRIILHTSFVGHNKRHVTNILNCYGLSPGTNYVSLRRENDLLGKMRQVKKLGGSPIVFMEAIGDDVNEHCAVLDFVCAADSQKRTTRVSFEEHDVDAAKAKDTATATEPSTKFVVIFGRPKRVMRMRNVLGDRNDVAFVFTPATPCEIANVVSRVHAVLANARRRGPKTFSQKKTRGPSSMDLARHGFPRAADVSGASLNLPASAFAKTTFETAFAEATKKSARASSSGAA